MVNLPLNAALQRLDTAAMDPVALGHARLAFEPRWNRWNVIRTVCALVTSLVLLCVLARL